MIGLLQFTIEGGLCRFRNHTPGPLPFSSMNLAPNIKVCFPDFLSSITGHQFLRLHHQ